MYFLYGAIALWILSSLICYTMFLKKKLYSTFWFMIPSTLSTGMLFWFIYSFANAVGTVFSVVFENQQQLAAMIGRGT